MARRGGEKTRCSGQWTEAKFISFVKNALRSASMKWGPRNVCLGKARIKRGVYLCNGCKQEMTATVIHEGRRVKNVFVDHIDPIVPVSGFEGWDSFVEGLFCEEDKLQVLCKPCHDKKSKEETAERAAYRRAAKEVKNE